MYQIVDLAKVSGSPLRSTIFWADKGALVALPGTGSGGQGTHRQFARDEAIVACILGAFYLDGAPISRLISVAQTVRGLLANPATRREIENAVQGSDKSFLIFDQMPSPLFFPGIPMADGTRNFDGIRDYVLTEMSGRNRKANIVALHACLAALKSYVPGGSRSGERDARGSKRRTSR